MTAKRKVPRTNQQQYNDLKDAILNLGTILWEVECKVYLHGGGHLEVSAGGYVKYEHFQCDTPAKILDGMRATLTGIIADIKTRRDELDGSLTDLKSILTLLAPQ